MPYRCKMCHYHQPGEFSRCPDCGADHKQIENYKDPEIIRLEFYNGEKFVSIYKEGYFGYINCRIFGDITRDMDRERQFYLSHPDDLTWKIKGCAGTQYPTKLNGNDISGLERILSEQDEITIGNFIIKVSFVRNI